jgi:hypothetical protein
MSSAAPLGISVRLWLATLPVWRIRVWHIGVLPIPTCQCLFTGVGDGHFPLCHRELGNELQWRQLIPSVHIPRITEPKECRLSSSVLTGPTP